MLVSCKSKSDSQNSQQTSKQTTRNTNTERHWKVHIDYKQFVPWAHTYAAVAQKLNGTISVKYLTNSGSQQQAYQPGETCLQYRLVCLVETCYDHLNVHLFICKYPKPTQCDLIGQWSLWGAAALVGKPRLERLQVSGWASSPLKALELARFRKMRGCARNWDRRVGGCAYLPQICVKDWLLEGWEFSYFRQMGEWAGQDGNRRLWGFAHLWGGGVPQGEEVVVLPPLLHLHLPPWHLLRPSCSSSSSCFVQRGFFPFLFWSIRFLITYCPWVRDAIRKKIYR